MPERRRPRLLKRMSVMARCLYFIELQLVGPRMVDWGNLRCTLDLPSRRAGAGRSPRYTTVYQPRRPPPQTGKGAGEPMTVLGFAPPPIHARQRVRNSLQERLSSYPPKYPPRRAYPPHGPGPRRTKPQAAMQRPLPNNREIARLLPQLPQDPCRLLVQDSQRA